MPFAQCRKCREIYSEDAIWENNEVCYNCGASDWEIIEEKND